MGAVPRDIVDSPAALLARLREGGLEEVLLQARYVRDSWAEYATPAIPEAFDPDEVAALCASSLLRQLRSLQIWADPKCIVPILSSAHLCGLTALELQQCTRPETLAAIVENRGLRQLERLELSGGWVDASPVERLAGGALPNLRELIVGGCAIGEGGLEALSMAEGLPKLRVLALYSVKVSAELTRRLRDRFGDAVTFR